MMTKYVTFIKKALSGEEVDYTQGSIKSAVLFLAIPMMLEMAMESVFALVDLYFVGHLKESSYAIRTVGLTESVLSVMYSIAIQMSMAATVLQVLLWQQRSVEVWVCCISCIISWLLILSLEFYLTILSLILKL